MRGLKSSWHVYYWLPEFIGHGRSCLLELGTLEEGLAKRQQWSMGKCEREGGGSGCGGGGWEEREERREEEGREGKRGGEGEGKRRREEGRGERRRRGGWDNSASASEMALKFQVQNLGHTRMQQVGSQTHEVNSSPSRLPGNFLR